MNKDSSDAHEYFFRTYFSGTAGFKTNTRRETAEEEAERLEKKRQKDLPQFLKPGYKIIDHGSERPEHNWWNYILYDLDMEDVQIEQNE